MKICICCSLTFTDEVKKITKELEKLGHEVFLPNGVMIDAIKKKDFDPVAAKHDGGYDAIRAHFDKIKESDAVLICNYTKKGVENYIGANTFLEAGFAYYLNKPTYALNPLPEYPYIHDEILSLGIMVLDGDLKKIKEEPKDTVKDINSEIRHYIETKILPRYQAMSGHTDKHIRQVMKRSLAFAKTVENINLDMAYVIAAYHDLGREVDDDHHEIESGKMLRGDQKLKEFFSPEQIETMAQAVEDHRASNKNEPRSIYGKIVSSADRSTSVEDIIERYFEFMHCFHPEKSEDEIAESARNHLRKKYCTDGYAAKKMYFPDADFKLFLKQVEEITRTPESFSEYWKKFYKRGL